MQQSYSVTTGIYLESSFAFRPELSIDYIYSNDAVIDLTDFVAQIFA